MAPAGKVTVGSGEGRAGHGEAKELRGIPPTMVLSDKRDGGVTREWEQWCSQILPAFIILVFCPCISCLGVTPGTSQKVFICSFQHSEEILKNRVTVMREEVQYPLLLLWMNMGLQRLKTLTDRT